MKTKLQWIVVMMMAISAPVFSQTATITAPNLTLVQGQSGNIIISASVNGDLVDGVTLILEIEPTSGAIGTVTFTPAASSLEEDIFELNPPFTGGTVDTLDTNDTLSLLRNGLTHDSGFLPASTTYNAALASFPIISSADADGLWIIRLVSVAFPTPSSQWNPSTSVTTTLVEGTITVSPPFCNGDAECDDFNLCTNDNCVSGRCAHQDNTLPCDDGLFCTDGDVCSAGVCGGTTKDCNLTLPADQCNDSVCNESLAQCELAPVTDTTPCDDGNLCTLNDACSIGVCGGTDVVCTALDQCHDAGTCNPATGNCDDPVSATGTLCDDSDSCTVADQCEFGSCSGLPMDCSADDDQCNLGVCVGGVCGPTPVVDTTTCDDLNGCSANDQCLAGVCTGSVDVACQTCVIAADCVTADPCLAATCVGGACQFDSNDTCPSLGIHADLTCYDTAVNNLMTITVDLNGLAGLLQPIIGAQFFLEYDATRMTFQSITPVAPFTTVLQNDATVPGLIDYSAFVPFGDPGTLLNSDIAIITFLVTQTCDPFLDFRVHDPPNGVVDQSFTLLSSLNLDNLPQVRIDGIAPVFSVCQSNLGDIEVPKDAGQDTAVVSWMMPVASDNCDGPRAIECIKELPGGAIEPTNLTGDVLPAGITKITCKAVDSCENTIVANQSECTFNVTVSDNHEMVTSIELDSTFDPVTRCIEFSFYNCNDPLQPVVTSSKVIGFTNGLANSVSVRIPSGTFTCIEASDTLHTLASTSPDFSIDGVSYAGTFLGNPFFGGDALRGGNLNGDGFIDIIDFALLFQQIGLVISSNTSCSDVAPHADFSGNGFVSTEDFNVLRFNFGRSDVRRCCVAPTANALSLDTPRGPILSISAEELEQVGLGYLMDADLNNDGWLDLDDMNLISADDRPTRDNLGKKLKQRSQR